MAGAGILQPLDDLYRRDQFGPGEDDDADRCDGCGERAPLRVYAGEKLCDDCIEFEEQSAANDDDADGEEPDPDEEW